MSEEPDWTLVDATMEQVKEWLRKGAAAQRSADDLTQAAFEHFARPFHKNVIRKWAEEAVNMSDGNDIIQTWFALRDEMLRTGPEAASAIRPPALRDACYAHALAHRTQFDTAPATIEAFVNGLELGCILALREVWESAKRPPSPTVNDETQRLWMAKQKKAEES